MKEEKPNFEHPQPQSNQPAYGQVDGTNPDLGNLVAQVRDLSDKLDSMISNHIHNGSDAQRINLNTDIIGLFETVSAVPTIIPIRPYDQIKFYSSGATYRLYMYDVLNNVWRYTTLT